MQLFVLHSHKVLYCTCMLTPTFTVGLDMYGGIVMPPLVR